MDDVKTTELDRLLRALRAGHRPGLRRRRAGGGPSRWSTSTSGASAAATSAPWITWFLIGGDLYTAYTFVAVPALIYGAGAARLLRRALHDRRLPDGLPRRCPAVVGRRTGTATSRPPTSSAAATARRTLALVVALTGIVATMPYIALQLVGIQAVLKTMGVQGEGIAGDLPLIIAFAILAVYTYQSGLRAPALIAFVKDTLIYIVVIVAIIYIPGKLGGWDDDLRRGRREVRLHATAARGPGRRAAPRRPAGARLLDARVRLGAGAVHLPALDHRRARQPQPRRHQAQHGGAAGVQLRARPARAARLHGDRRRRRRRSAQTRRPAIPDDGTRSCRCSSTRCSRTGSPASPSPRSRSAPWSRRPSCPSPRRTCSPATSTRSTSTRTPPRRRRRRSASSPRWWSRSARCWSILGLDPQFSIDLQLIGGVIILQTLPAIVLGLYTRWFHRWALLAGWAVGHGARAADALQHRQPAAASKEHFGGPLFPLSELGIDSDSVDLHRPDRGAGQPRWWSSSVTAAAAGGARSPAAWTTTHETDYHVEAGDPDVDVTRADTGDRSEVTATGAAPTGSA